MAAFNIVLLLPDFGKHRAWISNLFASSYTYDTVTDEAEVSSFNLRGKPKSCSDILDTQPFKGCVLFIATAILTIELTFIILGYLSTPGTTINKTFEDNYQFANTSGQSGCGETAETALAHGCKFDFLTIAWETPECYYSDIVDSFSDVYDWKYYNDSIGTPIPSDVSITDGHQRWNVKWDFHVTHCVYTWYVLQFLCSFCYSHSRIFCRQSDLQCLFLIFLSVLFKRYTDILDVGK